MDRPAWAGLSFAAATHSSPFLSHEPPFPSPAAHPLSRLRSGSLPEPRSLTPSTHSQQRSRLRPSAHSHLTARDFHCSSPFGTPPQHSHRTITHYL
ncbi:hypothetical protein RJT34_32794 [Clitoria ternatea]|uniref:Uncharacterized protein n=1 Tax=Clitoria ternatea TaxID=43366 RepID=A0AAN9I2M9_CLITE